VCQEGGKFTSSEWVGTAESGPAFGGRPFLAGKVQELVLQGKCWWHGLWRRLGQRLEGRRRHAKVRIRGKTVECSPKEVANKWGTSERIGVGRGKSSQHGTTAIAAGCS